MIYFPESQKNLELKEKFINLLTDLNQMVGLRDFINSLKAA